MQIQAKNRRAAQPFTAAPLLLLFGVISTLDASDSPVSGL
jgi:hypothetical protein